MLIALLREARVSIEGSRLRTFLAVLGIVIGVGSVVLMMAIGDGSKRAVEEAIDSLGSDLLVVSPGNKIQKGLRKARKIVLSLKDADAIAQLPQVVATAPSTSDHKFTAEVGKLNSDTQVTGVTPDYFLVRNRTFAEGDSFTADDMRAIKNEAVLGTTLAEKLFPDEMEQGKSLVDSSVVIEGVPFHVAGVLTPKGPSYDGRDQDDLIFVPITTAKSRLLGENSDVAIRSIFVKVASKEVLDEVTEDIVTLLRQRQNLTDAVGDNFTVRNLVSIMKVATDTTQALSLLLGSTAAISLVVGGIGIMNIMLVTVTERTREIGIRKALGATERHIMTQFLMEAVIIASFGSFIGLVIGIGGGLAAQEWFALRVEFSEWSVVLALVVAVGVGIASGLYPAYIAAKLQPIEALRMQGA